MNRVKKCYYHSFVYWLKMLCSPICACAQRSPLFIIQTVYLGFYFILCSCKAWLYMLCLDNLLYSRIMKIEIVGYRNANNFMYFGYWNVTYGLYRIFKACACIDDLIREYNNNTNRISTRVNYITRRYFGRLLAMDTIPKTIPNLSLQR
jgi:hypothetical protein